MNLKPDTRCGEMHCPFLNSPCVGPACGCWRRDWKRIDRDTREPLGYCGVAGQAGVHNPRAITRRSEPSESEGFSHAHARPPARDPAELAVGKNSSPRVVNFPVGGPTEDGGELI